MDVASIIEAAAAKRVLVVGSLPPEGRDWDLFLHDDDRTEVEVQLRAAGFVSIHGRWVRPVDRGLDVVELLGRAEWRLSGHEVDRLFMDAIPLDGHARLCVPSPTDRLLILARKLPRTPGFLEPKQRERIRATLSEDPAAFARARQRAGAWRVERNLRRLEARFARGPRNRQPPSFLRAPRRGAIIAFSGLDGVGKSTQAQALKASLAALGYDADLVWTPIGQSPSLRRFASAVKRLLSRLPAGPLAGARGEAVESHILSRTEPGTLTFGTSRKLASHLWSSVTSLANAIAFRRAAHGSRTRGRIVIYDRYVLDTVVELRFLYGPEGRRRFQEALVRALAPKPDRAYLLDISPEVAHQRKPDWSLDQTRLRAGLYGGVHAHLGVRRLDASRPAKDLSGEILREVLRSLPG